jgi:hypothetical protein
MTDDTRSRTEEIQTERRRRSGMGLERTLKLYYPEGLKDNNFVYRWFNDAPGRIEAKTIEDDWDVVVEKKNGTNTEIRRPVDSGRTGQPLYAYLCRKPKHLYEQDKAEEQKVITAQENAMRKGPPPSAPGAMDESSTTYVPGGRNVIG